MFVVNTPLQLLNAAEASAAYGSNNACVIILYWERWPKRAFYGLLQRGNWATAMWVPMDIRRVKWGQTPGSAGARLAEYVWMWQCARQRRWLERAFAELPRPIRILGIGNYCQSYMRHVLNRIPHEMSVALDDGTDSLKAMNLRRHSAGNDGTMPEVPDRQAPMQRIKRSIARTWIEMDDRHPLRPVEFFSVYELGSAPATTIRRNNYTVLRQEAHFSPQRRSVLFLGQPLVEDGYIGEEDFESLLQGVARCYGEQDLRYVPHKRETSVSRSLVERHAFRMLEFDDPIELALATGQTSPVALSSFFCSALENCRLMFGESLKIESVRIPENMLRHAHSDVREIYAYMQSAGIVMQDVLSEDPPEANSQRGATA